jgi:HPt (histidine-containing phosphotransfer) domain-containing protein
METTGQSGAPRDAALSQAIDGLWQRFLPEIRERVTILESAVAAVADRNLAGEQRETARAAAHKLAGVLGTFGLARGTDLARELEIAFARESSPSPDVIVNLAALAAELRVLIESRKPSA